MATTRKLQYKAVKGTASSHVGSPGDIFYNPDVAELRMYDGNAGGMVIGGSGGSNAIMFTTPTDGSTVTVTLPAPAAVGAMYTVCGTLAPQANGQISIVPTLLPGQSSYAFYGLDISAINQIQFGGSVDPDGNYIKTVGQTAMYQIVYLGGISAGDPIARYQIFATGLFG